MTQSTRYVTKFLRFQAGIQAIVAQLQAQSASEDEIASTVERATEFFLQKRYAERAQANGTSMESERPSVEVPTSTSASTRSAAPSSSCDLPAAQTEVSEKNEPPVAEASAQGDTQYPASFNAIVELIATGQEDKLTGVNEIPLHINEAAPSVSTMERPKKPWE